MRPTGNPEDTVPPDSLFYEMWNGPAPMMPYNPLFHPQTWRGFMEFSNGIIGDMGVHMLDTVRFLMDLDWPKSIRSEGGILVDKKGKANTTDTQVATFDYNDLKVTWQHRSWGLAPRPELDWTKQWGVTFYGELGSLRLTSVDYEFIPAGDGERVRGDAVTEELDASNPDYDAIDRAAAVAERAHWRDFLDAIETRKDPVASIEEGQISSASCVLANMAMKLQRSLTYNGLSRTVRGDREANELLARPYRDPWKHPADRRS
jgi:predicted dehydrogenase